jgi:hypothetical protein
MAFFSPSGEPIFPVAPMWNCRTTAFYKKPEGLNADGRKTNPVFCTGIKEFMDIMLTMKAYE